MAVNSALSNQRFQRALAFGQQAETDIAFWMIHRGHLVLPIYDVEYETGKGPRVFYLDGELVAPDLLILKRNGELIWAEAKHKRIFTWYRKNSRWTTGIDAHHYRGYLTLQSCLPHPVWLMFLHASPNPDARDLQHNCPAACPTGLFGDTIEVLAKKISHTSDKWGRHGMVYWAHDDLRLLATLEEVQSVAAKARAQRNANGNLRNIQ